MRILAGFLLIGFLACPLAAEDEAPTPLSWEHEGFASISKAANEAKAQNKRLLIGLSGGPT